MKLGAMGTYPQRVLTGLWKLRTPTRPLQVKARRPTLNLGRRRSDREDSESDAPYTPELDIVFDALVELAGDGRCWVNVRQIQAQTSLRLWRMEELLEEWECMGVICRDDTRRNCGIRLVGCGCSRRRVLMLVRFERYRD